MRVIHGRADTPRADVALTRRLVEESNRDTLRVWTPHKVVAFGRRDTTREGYDRAREAAITRGYTPLARSVGGHAVAFSGATVAFALVSPSDGEQAGITARYEWALDRVETAFDALGVAVSRTEPSGSFCPGAHSLSNQGKIVGLAQRVHRDRSLTSGIIVVRDHKELADVLAPVYDALSIPFDAESVGSVARAGGPSHPATVIEAIQEAFLDGREPSISEVDDIDRPAGVRDT